MKLCCHQKAWLGSYRGSVVCFPAETRLLATSPCVRRDVNHRLCHPGQETKGLLAPPSQADVRHC